MPQQGPYPAPSNSYSQRPSRGSEAGGAVEHARYSGAGSRSPPDGRRTSEAGPQAHRISDAGYRVSASGERSSEAGGARYPHAGEQRISGTGGYPQPGGQVLPQGTQRPSYSGEQRPSQAGQKRFSESGSAQRYDRPHAPPPQQYPPPAQQYPPPYQEFPPPVQQYPPPVQQYPPPDSSFLLSHYPAVPETSPYSVPEGNQEGAYGQPQESPFLPSQEQYTAGNNTFVEPQKPGLGGPVHHFQVEATTPPRLYTTNQPLDQDQQSRPWASASPVKIGQHARLHLGAVAQQGYVSRLSRSQDLHSHSLQILPGAGEVKWHMESLLILTIYTAMLVVNIIYFAFRFRYTLKTAVNPQDRSSTARYRVSAYPVICIIVEILCAAAMAVYAISKVYYRKTKWAPDQRHKALAAQSPLNVHVCVACCGEETHEIKTTLVKAAEALLEAGQVGMARLPCSGIWLCDDTPAARRAPDRASHAGQREAVASEYDQVLERSPLLRGRRRPLAPPEVRAGLAALQRLQGGGAQLTRRQQRMQLMLQMQSHPKYGRINFVHRYADDPVRRDEYNKRDPKGKPLDNHKSCNLNSTFRLMFPDPINSQSTKCPPWGRTAESGLSDDDIIIVLDADQECHVDFLTEVLPCFKAGIKSDNLVLVQSPQVFKGVNYRLDILNHQNVEFWSTMMPSYNTTGFISCAGTNFAIKAAALRQLGSDPFPRHTVTEDFALGMRLRAQNPPLTGIYLATEFVSGGAPDTIRKAFRQRSRWSKGPWEMLFSKESPLWYARGSGPDNTGKNKLSIRDRISFLAPVYNVIVNAVATPFLCFVPVFWMFTGHFPATMTRPTVGLLIASTCFTLFFKYYGRPSLGVEHIVWREEGTDDEKSRGEGTLEAEVEFVEDGQARVAKPKRAPLHFLSYWMSEWNADQNIRCFWWLFFKVMVNSILVKMRFKDRSGFKSTAGPAGQFFEGFSDVAPLTAVMLLLWITIIWGFLQHEVGVRLAGPLGITMSWALYQSVPFWNQLLYVVCRVRHEPTQKGCCWCYENVGRVVFQALYVGSFIISWGAILMAAVLALKTDHREFSQNVFTDSTGRTNILYVGPREVVRCFPCRARGCYINTSTGLCVGH